MSKFGIPFWLQVRKTRLALSGLTGFETQKTDVRLAVMTIVIVSIFIIGESIYYVSPLQNFFELMCLSSEWRLLEVLLEGFI